MTDRTAKRGIGRRDFLRYAGYAGVALWGGPACSRRARTRHRLAAGPTAEIGAGALAGRSSKSPAGLQVFDWSGYGSGDYYPREKRQFPGDRTTLPWPPATHRSSSLFENDDAGDLKIATGAHYDVVHPCAYRFKDYVDLGVRCSRGIRR